MSYILAVYVITYGGSITSNVSEYTNKASCEQAQHLIVSDLEKQKGDTVLSHHFDVHSVAAYCTPKTL